MFTPLILFLSLSSRTSSASLPPRNGNSNNRPWSASRFNSLITFGDSYTDENRLLYFFLQNNTPPPPGTLLPESYLTPSGGRTWPRYVVQYTGEAVEGEFVPGLELYNYAVSGAVCSNEITPKFTPFLNGTFPTVREYEIPAFEADMGTIRNGTSTPYFTPELTPKDTVYTLWIGTNDLGANSFLTASQIPGKTLPDYTSCIFSSLDDLYTLGARNFVLFNLAPLDLAPLYANESYGGVDATWLWEGKNESFIGSNKTETSEVMRQYTRTVNEIYEYGVGFEAVVKRRWQGSEVVVFDVHRLLTDIYTSPSAYLNGTTAPISVTGFENHCNANYTICVEQYGGNSPDSWFWFDELHPSEQIDRVIARSFVDILDGGTEYATFYSG